MSPIIKVENITKVYSRKGEQIYALKDVNFEVAKGEFVSIVGHSGSGKSTLLDILSCIIKPTSGKVWINGDEVAHASERLRTKIRREVISTIYQEHNLIPVLNAFQNVELPLRLKKIDPIERREIVNKYLKLVGLEERSGHKPDELSGGEKQRVAIARSLAISPKIIFADEPTGSLDQETGKQIIDLILETRKQIGTTIVLVTHDLNLADMADKIIEINKGMVINIKNGK